MKRLLLAIFFAPLCAYGANSDLNDRYENVLHQANCLKISIQAEKRADEVFPAIFSQGNSVQDHYQNIFNKKQQADLALFDKHLFRENYHLFHELAHIKENSLPADVIPHSNSPRFKLLLREAEHYRNQLGIQEPVTICLRKKPRDCALLDSNTILISTETFNKKFTIVRGVLLHELSHLSMGREYSLVTATTQTLLEENVSKKSKELCARICQSEEYLADLLGASLGITESTAVFAFLQDLLRTHKEPKLDYSSHPPTKFRIYNVSILKHLLKKEQNYCRHLELTFAQGGTEGLVEQPLPQIFN